MSSLAAPPFFKKFLRGISLGTLGEHHKKQSLFSFFWVRLYAFSSHFCPEFQITICFDHKTNLVPGAEFNIKVGDCKTS